MFIKKIACPKFLLYWLKFFYIIALFYLCGLLIVKIYDQNKAFQYDSQQTLPSKPNSFSTHILAKKVYLSRVSSSKPIISEFLIPPKTPKIIAKTESIFESADPIVRSRTKALPNDSAIWPEDSNSSDRIVEQMAYVPLNYYDSPLNRQENSSFHRSRHGMKFKIIYVYTHLHPSWGDVPYGKRAFINMKCRVKNCHITDDLEHKRAYRLTDADAVLFRNTYPPPHLITTKRVGQIWIFHSLESPRSMQAMGDYIRGAFNWTATYRFDSDIVTPYFKYVPKFKFNVTASRDLSPLKSEIDSNIFGSNPESSAVTAFQKNVKMDDDIQEQLKGIIMKETRVNYAANKSKLVAWFVSNCQAQERYAYAQKLQKHIQVDIYGQCGTLQCGKDSKMDCFKMLDSQYKFYLSFENSRCKDYITEKFFENGLSNKILPIVMGPSKGDYLKVAPHQSFIHVDDFNGPAHLAKFLHVLAQNDHLYNSFLAWKEQERGSFIDTKFWCRLCAMLHDPRKDRTYRDFNEWWSGRGVCKIS